ncbi:cytosolic factor, phosphatidylinositol/phosphatidylcholine transfer protein, partial [Kappamyces sp. JEL0680]
AKQRQFYNASVHDDVLLLRFLNAREGNVDKAVEMFNNFQQWRIEEHVDDIHKVTFNSQAVWPLYPRFFHKTDRLGRPIWIKQHHNFNITEILNITGEEGFIRHHIRESEKLAEYRLRAAALKSGATYSQVVLIMDLQGISYMQLPKAFKILGILAGIDSDYYPETMAKVVVINASVLFASLWRVIKTILPAVTVEKTSILGSSYQEELLELIAPENLPRRL